MPGVRAMGEGPTALVQRHQIDRARQHRKTRRRGCQGASRGLCGLEAKALDPNGAKIRNFWDVCGGRVCGLPVPIRGGLAD